jgi:hypothetical protein
MLSVKHNEESSLGEKLKRASEHREDLRLAKAIWHPLNKQLIQALSRILGDHKLSVSQGDLVLLNGRWYVTHAGLLRIATRNRCMGIRVLAVPELSDAHSSRYAFRATVYKSAKCRGFVGFGDANPSNVSLLVQGAELRVAETRAVNRALRKAYGIGICSVEEVGSSDRALAAEWPLRKLPPELARANDRNGHGSNASSNGTRVRDRLCQLIRQHRLDAEQVKAYAVDFCGTKTLREASREQVERFVVHLADWAKEDRNALLCQLNCYQRPRQEPATHPQGAA